MVSCLNANIHVIHQDIRQGCSILHVIYIIGYMLNKFDAINNISASGLLHSKDSGTNWPSEPTGPPKAMLII